MRSANEHRPRPTLLVFTLGAEAECRRRRLLPVRHTRVEAAFHRACLESALAAGRAAGCRLAVATNAGQELPADAIAITQHGSSFGERFKHAVADAETLADGPLLIVGTDVPDLRTRHLRLAIARLETTPERVVVGPSPDGGFYLLAATASLAGLLDGVHWCRRDTSRTLASTLEAAGRPIERLEPLHDLDHTADLEQWLARGPRPLELLLPALTALRRLLAACKRPLVPRHIGRARLVGAGDLGGRAPPPKRRIRAA